MIGIGVTYEAVARADHESTAMARGLDKHPTGT